jgi:hypothetical protein
MIKTFALALVASLRPSPKTCLIALLSLSSLAGFNAYASTSPDHALREKDVKRAESIIARLRALENARPASANSQPQPIPFEKISDRLFVQVAALRASDLKTDLATAIFLYDEAARAPFGAESARLDCESELREVYARLCRETKSGTLAHFLRAKARLHLQWAEATINDYLGIKDGATLATLEEMRRERRHDVKLAEQAVTALKILERDVYDYASLAKFEEHRRLATVSFERLSADVSEMRRRVDTILVSLPRSPLFYPLYHARNAYVDGLFWWQKTYRQSKLVVNVNSFTEPDEMKSSNLDAHAVNYTVAINWRKAIRHTREAAQMIEALNLI